MNYTKAELNEFLGPLARYGMNWHSARKARIRIDDGEARYYFLVEVCK